MFGRHCRMGRSKDWGSVTKNLNISTIRRFCSRPQRGARRVELLFCYDSTMASFLQFAARLRSTLTPARDFSPETPPRQEDHWYWYSDTLLLLSFRLLRTVVASLPQPAWTMRQEVAFAWAPTLLSICRPMLFPPLAPSRNCSGCIETLELKANAIAYAAPCASASSAACTQEIGMADTYNRMLFSPDGGHLYVRRSPNKWSNLGVAFALKVTVTHLHATCERATRSRPLAVFCFCMISSSIRALQEVIFRSLDASHVLIFCRFSLDYANFRK